MLMERAVLPVSVVTHPRSRVSRLRKARGFTLVELAVVVTIVAVLSVIALVGYRKYMLNAKITEAKGVISAIRISQEDYKAEKGIYANLGTTFCPAGAGTGSVKVGWDPACDGGTAKWATLPVHVDGAVQFSYATIAANTGKPSNPFGWNFVDYSQAKDGAHYVVGAKCDLDSDSTNGETDLLGSSHDNYIRSHGDGT